MVKQRIVTIFNDLQRNGVRHKIYSKITKRLVKENIIVNRGFVRCIVIKFMSTGSIKRINGGG